MEQIIILALFSVWFTQWFSPLQKPKEWIIDVYIRGLIKINALWAAPLATVLTCPKCFGFWFTLLYTKSFALALSVGFLSYLIIFTINEIENRNENRN